MIVSIVSRARGVIGLVEIGPELGPFDEHGDLIDPPVRLWRAGADWALTPDRPLARHS
jgi:hypothetical protein